MRKSYKQFFTILAFVLCVLNANAQPPASTYDNAGAEYKFESGTFTIYRYGTKSQLDKINIDLDKVEPYDVFYECIFKEAYIAHGKIMRCSLPRGYIYSIDEDLSMTPEEKTLERLEIENEPGEEAPVIQHPKYIPLYKLSRNANKASVEVIWHYGDSRYGVPLTGILTLTLTKK
ncbi:hypothetical protein [Dysgonomonas capnocytophagoides]|uniref:hypothetical protein n=1 Tax=Dysgonomonas capnocytophagoides TaxID=45254 RepID=UPI002924F620|nr:hypothetical protein DCPSUM001_01810 [Dysgonomonas capnocytophagoides]